MAATLGVSVLLLASCNGGIEVGGEDTTTTQGTVEAAPPSTTTTAARRTTVVPKAKASAKATARKTAPSVPEPEEEPEPVDPRQLEPLVLTPDSTWRLERDADAGTGPADLNKAAADETEEGGSTAEAREFLDSLGFMAGYSREWEKAPSSTAHQAAFLYVSFYLFSTPQGADAMFKADVAAFEEAAEDSDMEPVTVGNMPRARAWWGGNDDDGYLAVQVFAKEHFSGRVLCRSTTSRFDYRGCLIEHGPKQYDRL